jgi:hypothetical protein
MTITSASTMIERRSVDLAGCESGAIFSGCNQYRYRLWRTWDAALPRLNFVMLNPSTADHLVNDPTVERCERRARMLGYGCLLVTNIFALRSTDPEQLYLVDDPIGPENDLSILLAAVAAGKVICAWGAHGILQERAAAVLGYLRCHVDLWHLGLTKGGHPRHPLYVGYDVQPALWHGKTTWTEDRHATPRQDLADAIAREMNFRDRSEADLNLGGR